MASAHICNRKSGLSGQLWCVGLPLGSTRPRFEEMDKLVAANARREMTDHDRWA